MSYATTDGQIPEPARPMPYTDFLTIGNAGQLAVSTPVQIATGGYVIFNNENGGMLRIGTDTTVLTTGFGLPAGSVAGFRFWGNQPCYIGCSTTCTISYVKGN